MWHCLGSFSYFHDEDLTPKKKTFLNSNHRRRHLVCCWVTSQNCEPLRLWCFLSQGFISVDFNTFNCIVFDTFVLFVTVHCCWMSFLLLLFLWFDLIKGCEFFSRLCFLFIHAVYNSCHSHMSSVASVIFWSFWEFAGSVGTTDLFTNLFMAALYRPAVSVKVTKRSFWGHFCFSSEPPVELRGVTAATEEHGVLRERSVSVILSVLLCITLLRGKKASPTCLLTVILSE